MSLLSQCLIQKAICKSICMHVNMIRTFPDCSKGIASLSMAGNGQCKSMRACSDACNSAPLSHYSRKAQIA